MPPDVEVGASVFMTDNNYASFKEKVLAIIDMELWMESVSRLLFTECMQPRHWCERV